MTKLCPGCEKSFPAVRGFQIYCTRRCQSRMQARKRLGSSVPGNTRSCRWCKKSFYATDARRDYCSAGCARFGELLTDVFAKYGITKDQYRDLYFEQAGKCAICKMPERTARNTLLCVDHDHESGQVRALLCSHCNRAIGLFSDDPNLLVRAAEYLTTHQRPRPVHRGKGAPTSQVSGLPASWENT